jgi:hypothetical protein
MPSRRTVRTNRAARPRPLARTNVEVNPNTGIATIRTNPKRQPRQRIPLNYGGRAIGENQPTPVRAPEEKGMLNGAA